jgi:hypothetical protein
LRSPTQLLIGLLADSEPFSAPGSHLFHKVRPYCITVISVEKSGWSTDTSRNSLGLGLSMMSKNETLMTIDSTVPASEFDRKSIYTLKVALDARPHGWGSIRAGGHDLQRYL